MPDKTTPYVQWAQGSASGAPEGWRTRCGWSIPRSSSRTWTHGFCDSRGGSNVTDADYCKRCAAAS